MARQKKRKQFRDFESNAILDNYREPYVCITKSMLTSEKWHNLSYSSQIIYINMKLWSYGRESFSYSYKLATKIVSSNSTFKKSIDELVSNGFLDIVRISRTPGIGTIYKFTNRWYK